MPGRVVPGGVAPLGARTQVSPVVQQQLDHVDIVVVLWGKVWENIFDCLGRERSFEIDLLKKDVDLDQIFFIFLPFFKTVQFDASTADELWN